MHQTPRLALLLTFIFLSLAISGCKSGTWTDDPQNFERAWGLPKPSDVEVPHSIYWRSGHFTREEAYYFQFAPNENLLQGFIANNKLEKTEIPQNWKDDLCLAKPVWFAPKENSSYSVWRCPPDTSCILLKDSETAEIFFAACQL